MSSHIELGSYIPPGALFGKLPRVAGRARLDASRFDRRPESLASLGQVQQWIQHFPACGLNIKFYRGSFCEDYGTGTRNIWCKTLPDGRRIVRQQPPIEGGHIHAAHDIHGARGDMLYAVENGVIVHRNTRESGDGGFTVKMFADPARGGSGRIYYYAHLRAAGFYGDGVEVIAGDHLGEMGDTGNARGRGPHLHFQALEMIGGVATPLDVYDELRAALVVEQGEEVALKVATESGGSINCTIPPGETGVPAGGSGGGLLLGLALAAGGAYFLTRKR